ncbi:MAG: metallophosphoesterase family protein [Gemmataceae bacterium]
MTISSSLPNTVYLAHISDIHITASKLEWQLRDWFSKRVTGWGNWRWFGRKKRFHLADEVLTLLMAEIRQRRPDHLVFSGDASALGFESEFIKAAQLLGVGDPDMVPGLAVPGNHDYYTPWSAAFGYFEKHFAPWQQGERIDAEIYPFAQRVGHVWLVGINSCTGNRWPWDAAGSVGQPQLDRLRELLRRLPPGLRFLVTHYPVRLEDGRPEERIRHLRDLGRVLAVAEQGGVCLWLHGHRHHGYHLLDPRWAPFPVICAGSATQRGVWSYNEYRITDGQLSILRRTYVPEQGGFQDSDTLELRLPAGSLP